MSPEHALKESGAQIAVLSGQLGNLFVLCEQNKVPLPRIITQERDKLALVLDDIKCAMSQLLTHCSEHIQAQAGAKDSEPQGGSAGVCASYCTIAHFLTKCPATTPPPLSVPGAQTEALSIGSDPPSLSPLPHPTPPPTKSKRAKNPAKKPTKRQKASNSSHADEAVTDNNNDEDEEGPFYMDVVGLKL
jgi:hypothetical protein